MIFSVQNSNLMYSVGFSRDLVHIQVREPFCGVFLFRMDIPIQVWLIVEVMQRDFNEHHKMQVPITENQLGTTQMMEEVTEHMGMNNPDISDSRFVAQPVDDFLFPWEEEMGSTGFPITIDEDKGFSESMAPPTLQQPPAMESRPALRCIKNLQNSYVARQLFD